MLTLLIGGILSVAIGAFLAFKFNKVICVLSVGLGGFFILLALLLITHRGSYDFPNFTYQAVVGNDGQQITIYFDDYKQSDGYVIIDDYEYYKVWEWTLNGYMTGESPITIKIQKGKSFIYKGNSSQSGGQRIINWRQ
jgi:hypothetical protein